MNMYDNILVALSLEHGIGDRAIGAARALLSEGGRITAVHVHVPPNSSILAYLEEGAVEKSRQTAKTRLAERVKDEAGVTSVLISGKSAGGALNEYANTHAIDCIVIASHQPEMKDYFLGSTATRVVRHARCAVHVLRG